MPVLLLAQKRNCYLLPLRVAHMPDTFLEEIPFSDEQPQLKHEFHSAISWQLKLLISLQILTVLPIFAYLLFTALDIYSPLVRFYLSIFVAAVVVLVFLAFLPTKRIILLITDQRIIKRTLISNKFYSSAHIMEIPIDSVTGSKVEAWKGTNLVLLSFLSILSFVTAVIFTFVIHDSWAPNESYAINDYVRFTLALITLLLISWGVSMDRVSRLSFYTTQTLKANADVAYLTPYLATFASPFSAGVMNVVVKDTSALEVLLMFAQHISARSSMQSNSARGE